MMKLKRWCCKAVMMLAALLAYGTVGGMEQFYIEIVPALLIIAACAGVMLAALLIGWGWE